MIANQLPPISEADFLRQVLELALLLGWKRAHFRPARTAAGWRTAVEGDGKGFPDLVLVRERVVWAELKAAGGKLSPEQQEWINVLADAGEEVYIWWPEEWEAIKYILRRP